MAYGGAITGAILRDNDRREACMRMGQEDPGRSDIDWFEGVKEGFSLIILHPAHFSINDHPVIIKHPQTGHFTNFYASHNALHEGCPNGPGLYLFDTRGQRTVRLNPILVNIAAMVRLRHFIRRHLTWGSTLDSYFIHVLKGVIQLHDAVMWQPGQPHKSQVEVEVTDSRSQQVTIHDLRFWPFHPPAVLIPGRPTPLSVYFDLIEAEFLDLPDLGFGDDGDGDDDPHPDLPSELGEMTSQEKIEKFLMTS